MSVSDYLLGLRHVGIVTEDLEGMVARLQAVFGIADGEVLRVPEPGQPADTRFAFFSIGGGSFDELKCMSRYKVNCTQCARLMPTTPGPLHRASDSFGTPDLNHVLNRSEIDTQIEARCGHNSFQLAVIQ